ncbi:hypothetical protein OA500_00730 [Gammaproteobacteria bacterium]|nr:hypothetical protein [Gammaproteobacteria bacterium]
MPLKVFCSDNGILSLNILVYNTHGLPEIFIDDNPKMRFPIIGEKTQDYNISLLQEDYSHHEELSSGLSKLSLAYRGGMGTLLCPFCTGSGLTSIFNLPVGWLIDVENETYEDCSGWLIGANDCFAYKGFQIIKVTPPNKKEFYILNTHMDAGRRNSDRSAREKQLEHIVSVIKQKTETKGLIVAGDLNLNSKDPRDMRLLKKFKEELSLTDTFKNTQIDKKWSVLDYILLKQGEDTKFKINSVGEDKSFLTEVGPLSDHPALSIDLSIY